MSILGDVINGVDDIAGIINSHFPGQLDEQKVALAAQEISQRLPLAQIATDTAEASSASVFVAGARPFVEWMCAFGLLQSWFISPIVYSVSNFFGHPVLISAANLPIQIAMLTQLLGTHAVNTYGRAKGL